MGADCHCLVPSVDVLDLQDQALFDCVVDLITDLFIALEVCIVDLTQGLLIPISHTVSNHIIRPDNPMRSRRQVQFRTGRKDRIVRPSILMNVRQSLLNELHFEWRKGMDSFRAEKVHAFFSQQVLYRFGDHPVLKLRQVYCQFCKVKPKAALFIMQYNSFIQSSFNTIRKLREAGLACQLDTDVSHFPTVPQNLFIQLLAQKNKQLFKIEQWNFKCFKTLVQSEYESNQDSELDSVELSKKSYSCILEQSLLKFNPKLLIKTLEPHRLILTLVSEQKQLQPFPDDDLCLVSIDDYEGNGFNCRVTLRTVHTEMNRGKQEMDFQSQDEEFQVLEDSAYQRQLRLELERQKNEQKMIQRQQQKSNRQQNAVKKQLNSKIESLKQSVSSQINISKYSTKEITVSEFQRKMQIVNETMDLIEDLKLEGQSLRNFLKRIQ